MLCLLSSATRADPGLGAAPLGSSLTRASLRTVFWRHQMGMFEVASQKIYGL